MNASISALFIPTHRFSRRTGRNKKIGAALEETLAKGQITLELRLALDDPVVRAAHWYELIAMAVVVFLMALKPF